MPDQKTTAGAGSIGLGTITGTVGAVRTDEAKNAAMAGPSGLGMVGAALALGVAGLVVV